MLKKMSCDNTLLSKQVVSELDTFLENLESRTLIIVFVNILYMPLFEIWYNYFRQYQLPNFLAISLDIRMNGVLNNLGVKNILLTMPEFDGFLSVKIYDSHEMNKLAELWRLRTRVFKHILDRGIHLLACDADAFWLKNIYPLVVNYRYDTSLSISHQSPPDVAKKWGFVLNCGFWMLRSNPVTKAFLDEFLKFSINYDSQQVALNRFLCQHDVKWKREGDMAHVGYVEKFKLSVKAISDNIVSRQPKCGLYVYHPFLEGEMDKKLSFAKENLLLLGIENNAKSQS